MAATQRLLTIDCGNSTIRCRRADGQVWATASTAPDFDGFAEFVAPAGADLQAVAVSVVAAALGAVREQLQQLGIALAVADEDLRCPLPLAYDTVATLGADRWLGAFAAYEQEGRAAAIITVDCGTATTVNVVDRAGSFLGGAIAPGLAAFVAGLGSKAPALPLADLDASPVMPAKSTQGSVDAGVLLGWAGLVERLVADARTALDQDAKVVLTGGNARRLLRLSPAASGDEWRHEPELLHDGLAALWHRSEQG